MTPNQDRAVTLFCIVGVAATIFVMGYLMATTKPALQTTRVEVVCATWEYEIEMFEALKFPEDDIKSFKAIKEAVCASPVKR